MDVHIDALAGRPGTEFTVSRSSRLAAIEDVQSHLGIFERGRASGVIGVTLEGNDPALTTAVLNQIGQEYVQQNANWTPPKPSTTRCATSAARST
ncbi:hypothetical protein G6F23_015450 [Rhizopus arrhizus]|nr:hypothetical protein G6F23_015450 [Rhizopus arrhizus]